MAEATIGGRTYAIAPFKLRELRRAAPFIDALSARAAAPAGVQGVAETAYDMLCVLAVGIEGVTAETLAAEASLEELSALHASFDQVLAEAGLTRPDGGPAGEGRPAAAPADLNPAAAPASPPPVSKIASTT